MCLAIVKPRGLHIPEKFLRAGMESNNDGCGMVWADDDKSLHVEKGMMTWEQFWELFQANQDKPMLVHFRRSTHGKKNADNCHPFMFNDGKLALIHNGTIPIKCSEEGYSDTWHLVYKVLEPLVKEHGVEIDSPSLSWLLKVAIGTDKIAIMDGIGEFVIFNEEKGSWEDAEGPDNKKGKVWFSNSSFRSTTQTYRYQGHGCGWTPGANSVNYHGTSPNRDVSGLTNADENEGEWEGFGYAARQARANAPLSGSNTQIATDENRGPGAMTEYGWYDKEIEEMIDGVKKKMGMQRDDAIIHVFNNA